MPSLQCRIASRTRPKNDMNASFLTSALFTNSTSNPPLIVTKTAKEIQSLILPQGEVNISAAVNMGIKTSVNASLLISAILRNEQPGTNTVNRKEKPTLLMCIPSAQRNGSSYLSMVLKSIDSDIRMTTLQPAAMDVEVLVVDVSVEPREPRVDIADSRRAFPRFHFAALANKTYENCTEQQLRTDEGGQGRPPCSVRQQTRDVTAAMLQCAARVAADGWVAMVEDDTEMCPGSVEAMTQALPRVAADRQFRFFAFSTYFSGTAFAAAAAADFARYAAGRLGSRPIDHLVWEDWGTGPYVQGAGNLFAHRGRVSVFEYRNTAQFREMWDGMRFSGRQSDCS